MRHTVALSLALIVAACDAQKPAATTTSPSTKATPETTTASTRKTPQYSEPSLTGRIVDATTKQPLEGVLVYGYYATQTGSVGGGRPLADQVRSFEAQTDANGVFTLPAWNTGDRVIRGEPMSLFPMISVYKPGYEMAHQNLKSIREWQSMSDIGGYPEPRADGVIDWTKYRYPLRPVATELQRYNALSDSSVGMMFIGECGWEAYAKTLLAQHDERKAMIAQFVPVENIDKAGYIRSGRPRTNPHVEYLTRTVVDDLIQKFEDARDAWKCASPKAKFSGAK